MSSLVSLVNRGSSALRGLTGGTDELARQEESDDGRYYQDIISFFELVVPQGPSFLFPLSHAPQQYALDEPFAAEITATDFAGLWVEESGIVQRTIRLVGHTGFKPQPLSLPVAVPADQSALAKNYTPRFLAPQVSTPISGQKIYEYLNESLFRAYSNLKRDPTTAQGTRLLFHNPRDGEHWQVVPTRFSLGRGPGNTYTYPYTIDMVAVGPAVATVLPLPAGDQGLLARLRNTIQTVKSALQGLNAAINDLTALQGSFTVLGLQVAGVIDEAGVVAQAAAAFVQGTKQLINVPLASVYALFNACTAVCELYASLADTGTALGDWPRAVLARFRAMQNACDQLLTQPGAFSPPLDGRLAQLGGVSRSQAAVDTVAATSFAAVRAAGTANLPGESLLAAPLAARTRPNYQTIRQVVARRGDTLMLVAARELGSVGAWRDLAALNNMLPPELGASDLRAAPKAEDAATGVLSAGQVLLVPSTQPPPAVVGNAAVLGARVGDDAATQVLGRDLAMASVGSSGQPLYDLSWGEGAAGADLAMVQGQANLSQALEQSVATAQGESPLYPDFGLQGYVGTGVASTDVSMRNYRLASALRADPRVSEVKRVTSQQYFDSWSVEALVVPVSGGAAVSLQMSVL